MDKNFRLTFFSTLDKRWLKKLDLLSLNIYEIRLIIFYKIIYYNFLNVEFEHIFIIFNKYNYY